MGNRVEVIFEIDRDQQGRTVLRQIDAGLDKIGTTALTTGKQVDAGLSLFKGALIVEFFRRSAGAAVEFGRDSVKAFNESQSAALGLSSVALFKGISGDRANEAVRDLQVVRDGLVSVSDATTSLKNLLASGFSLDQSITLINRIVDSAAFGRQASLSFGDAMRSATEGIKNQNSILVDNAGITKNLSVILKERGFQLQDLSDKTKGAAAREALYRGLLEETQAQVGDAARASDTFAGKLARVEAEQKKLLTTTGQIIAENKDFSEFVEVINRGISNLNTSLGDKDSRLRQFFEGIVSNAAKAADQIERVLKLISDLKGKGEGAGSEVTGLGIQQNLREKGVPTTGVELVGTVQELFDLVKKPGGLLDQGFEFLGLKDAGVSDLDEFLKKIDEDFKKLTAVPIVPETQIDAGGVLAKTEADIRASIEAHNKRLDALKKMVAEDERLEEARRKLARDAQSSIRALEAALSVDPFKALFDDAERQQREFMINFAKLPDHITQTLRKLGREKLSLDVFKQELSAADRLNTLLAEQERLRAGLAGQTIRDEAEHLEREREAIRREIRERRDAGTLDARTQAELINRLQAVGAKSRSDEIAARLLDRQISSAQEALAKADTLAKESLALERLIAFTSDVGRLNPQQVDIRMKALERQLAIEADVQAQKQAREDRLAQSQDNFVKAVDKLDGAISKFSESVGKASGGLSGDKPPATVIVKVEGDTSGVNVSRERLGLTTFHRGNGLYEEY